MPNIVILEDCNRSCVYCFAQERQNQSSKKSEQMTFEEFREILDFLDQSQIKECNLLGGEPSLHPELDRFIVYALMRDFRVGVFSNGMWPRSLIQRLKTQLEEIELNPEENRLTFMINVNEPEYHAPGEKEAIERFFQSFGGFCSLSFNIFKRGHDYDHLIEYIERFKIKPQVRVGLTHPIKGAIDNQYLALDDFESISADLVQLSEKMKRFISGGINFDCGFLLCKFTSDQLGTLFANEQPNTISFTCGSPIDIGPGLETWHCYPLSADRKLNLRDYPDLHKLIKVFKDDHREREIQKGVFEECKDCYYLKAGRCSGGCRAHFLQDIQN